MTSGRARLSGVGKCDGCGGPLAIAEQGRRCRWCAPRGRAPAPHDTRQQPTCGLGHPGCTISTNDDLAI